TSTARGGYEALGMRPDATQGAARDKTSRGPRGARPAAPRLESGFSFEGRAEASAPSSSETPRAPPAPGARLFGGSGDGARGALGPPRGGPRRPPGRLGRGGWRRGNRGGRRRGVRGERRVRGGRGAGVPRAAPAGQRGAYLLGRGARVCGRPMGAL